MYKNITKNFCIPPGYIYKMLLIMKLTTFILMISLMQVSAASFGQNFTLKQKIVTITKVFYEIRKQTGYDVLIENTDFKTTQRINANFSNTPLTEVMNQIVSGRDLIYTIEENTVVIKSKEKGFFEKLVARFRAITVRGKILDEKGQPLVGATVAIKGKKKSVKTEPNGAFYLENVGENDKLVISYIGYQTREVDVASDMGSLTMVLANAKLEEVTINAGYYTVKESERTGSISRITSKDIETQPVTNFLATMQGRMAGVEIIQETGMPGGGFNIKIRGQNSLRADGNQPLFIIDGIPYSSETIGAIATSGTMTSLTSPLNSINPADIESIEVLKDADATAIYGSRGANGVVLITTKKGKQGATMVNVNVSTGLGKVTRTPDLMNTEQYLEMRKQAFANDGTTVYPANAYDVNGTWDANRYTDWQKEFIGRTAKINQAQASVSGGGAHTQYLLSGNYRTETTVFPGDFKYNKGAAHFNMNHTSDDERFKLVFSANYTAQKNNQPATDLTGISRILAPNAPALYDELGNLNWENSTWDNPLAALLSEFDSRIKDLNANAVLTYQIFKNLQLKSSLGYSDLNSDERRTQPHTMYNPAYGVGSEISALSTNQTSRNSWIIEPQLNWSKEIGKGKLEALLGGTFQQQRTNRLFLNGFGFSSNSLIHDLTSASIKTIDLSDETIYKYQAFFARINYNYNERYIINITGRRDGSSRFGPGKQFAGFGAVGAAWIFSNEAFLKNNAILSFGKLRVSYGITGNDQIGDYQFLDTYASSGNIYQGVVGLEPVRLYNPEFGWETNRKFEMALETGFLKDRLFLTAAYYLNRSSNQLVGIPLPSTTGFSSLNANLDATVQNSGLEFTFRTVNFQRKNFEWTTNFNISASRNRLISYPGLESSTDANRYVIGQPINIIKLYHYTGMNTATGVYQFQDVNGDGVITSINDRKTAVDLSPRLFGGLQNQIKFNRLQLDFLFQFVKQRAFSAMSGIPGVGDNQLESVINSSTRQPYTAGANGGLINAYYRYVSSDGPIEDASYVRLKNVSLTYDLPFKSTYGVRCQVYMQGQNLLTFTKYVNGDPEAKISNYLPPLQVYTAGVKLTF
jgi:TonB-linked SusC/RagA family outer membrane protein